MRLEGWDYSWGWWYFVTIVVKDRTPALGNIAGEELHVSAFGNIVRETWLRIPKQYRAAELDEFVVMPNHVHGIIILSETSVGAIHESPLRTDIHDSHEDYVTRRRRMTLSKIIGWFKMKSAKEINLLRNMPGCRFWQRGYYDHIIRNDADLHRIRQYVTSNPLMWSFDEENPRNWQ